MRRDWATERGIHVSPAAAASASESAMGGAGGPTNYRHQWQPAGSLLWQRGLSNRAGRKPVVFAQRQHRANWAQKWHLWHFERHELQFGHDSGQLHSYDHHHRCPNGSHILGPGGVEELPGLQSPRLWLALPVRSLLHLRRRAGQHPRLSGRRPRQKAAECNQLLPLLAGNSRPAGQPLCDAYGRHTGVFG